MLSIACLSRRFLSKPLMAHGEFFDEPNLGPMAEGITGFLETPTGLP
jgi:hypothetical protein